MENVVSLASSKIADEQQEKIAKLRALFPHTYEPKFQVGDIVRVRSEVKKYLSKTVVERNDLFIVAMVRGEDPHEWRGYSSIDPDEDVVVCILSFDKEQQRETVGCIAYSSWRLELVERAS